MSKLQYLIYRLDFSRLYNKNRILDGYLECNYNTFKNSFYNFNDGIDYINECLLLDQTIKALNLDSNDINIFKDKLIFIDFNNSKNILNNIEIEGIKIQFEEGLLPITFKLFNSSEISLYINESIYELINNRTTFELNINKPINISNYFYYLNSLLDNANLHKSSLLNDWTNKIVIIDDLNMHTKINAHVRISVDYLYEELSKFNKSNLAGHNEILNNKSKEEFINLINQLYDHYEDEFNYDNLIIDKNNIKLELLGSNYNPNKSLTKKGFNNFSKALIKLMIYVIKKSLNDDFNTLRNNVRELLIFINEYYLNECKKMNRDIYYELIEISNYYTNINMFDKEGLISNELSNEINKDLFAFNIRLPFVKGILYKCDFKSFYKSHNIKYIKGLLFNGEERLFDINDIEIILTKSQFYYSLINNIKRINNESPFDSYIKYLNEYKYDLAISNSNLSNDNRIRLNKDIISILPINENIYYNHLIKPNFDLMNEELSNDNLIKLLKDKYKLANNINTVDFFINSKIFKDFKLNKINEYYVNNILNQNLYIKGYNKYLSSDLLELLYYSAGLLNEFINNKLYLKLNEYYSPHINNKIIIYNTPKATSDLLILNNSNSLDERIKYFNHLNNVIMVNPLSGSVIRLDYSNEVYIINNLKLVNYLSYKLIDNPIIINPKLKINKELFNLNNIYKHINIQSKEVIENSINNKYYDEFELIKSELLNDESNEIKFDLKELNKSHYDGDINNINFILVSLFLYKNFNKMKNNIKNGINNKSLIEADINKILESNGFDISNIIFKSNAMDIYLSNSYQYLCNDVERERILNELDIDSNYHYLFNNYKRNGQYLLYLMILNNNLNGKNILLNNELNIKLAQYKKKCKLNEGLLKSLYSNKVDAINKFILRFKNESKYKLADLEMDIYNELSNLVRGIDLADIIGLIGYKAENEGYFIYCLSDNIINYVEGRHE